MKSKKTNLSKYEWINFTNAYLALARIGIEELCGRKYINKKHPFENIAIYENKVLLIPIIWNLKHAMEIIIKSLGIAIDKEYFNTHNTDDLMADLKQRIQALKIFKQNKSDELVGLVYKYYKCEFWDKRIISDSVIFDIQNDIFRYPDNSATFILDASIFKSTSEKEIEELHSDVDIMYRLFHILHSQISQKTF